MGNIKIGHNRSVAIFPQSRPSRSVSGAFRFKAILALPALSRRPEDYRRHRRACGDCQGYSRTWACLCAPPRSPARPLALFQAGLILKAKAVLQCPDDPARPALACSGQTVSKRFGPIQGSNNHRERKFSQNTAPLTAFRAGDIVADGEKVVSNSYPLDVAPSSSIPEGRVRRSISRGTPR